MYLLFKSRKRDVRVIILQELLHFRAADRLRQLLDGFGILVVLTGNEGDGEGGIFTLGDQRILLRSQAQRAGIGRLSSLPDPHHPASGPA